MRLAMALVMAGMAIGATLELAVAHWREGDVAQSRTARSIDEEPLAEGAAVQAVPDVPVVSTLPARATAGVDDLTVTRPQAFCNDASAKDLAAAFLNPTCGSDKPHARHPARTPYRVATVIIGHSESPPAETESKPVTVAAIEPSHAVVSGGGSVIPTVQPAERQAPPKKPKAPRSAPIVLTPPAREPTEQDGASMAFAAVPRPGIGSYQRPGDIFRAMAMPPSSGVPFGGIW